MIWVPWPKSDPRGLARYVFPDATKQFKLTANRLDMVRQHGRLVLVQHIYEQLQTFGIQYVHEKFHPNPHVQLLRSPRELLEAPSEGTCIDLATLFCGVCLGCDLLPLMVRLSDHALAAVSLEYDRREFEHRARRNHFDKGLLLEPERLWEWVDRGKCVAVECTGFAYSATLDFGEDETALRQHHNGVLPFEKAIDIGKTQLKRTDLIFVGDIAMLHSQGYAPLSLDIINLVDHLAENLLDDVGKRTAQRFAEADRRQALHDALATSLAAVTSHIPPTSETYTTDLINLSKFAKREEVIGQFSQLLKPQKGASLDLDLLYDEFLEAGFTTEQFSQDAFANLIGDLIEAFHDAVAAQPALRDVINIALLRQIADGIERTAVATERTADATESTEALTRILVEETVQGRREASEGFNKLAQILQERPDHQFDMFQIIMATLGQSDVVVDIDAQREIQINSRSSLVNPAAPTIDRFRILLLELFRSILQNQDTPQQLALLRSRYIDGLIDQFKFLRLEGLTTEVKPLNLPLEQVYVQLRAVAEIPDVADAFSPDERRVLRLVEEAERRGEDGAEEQLQEAYLQLDALRRERWSRERLERFPISEALADNRQRALVILGDPGSGKTTLLQFLALVFARGPEAVAEYLNVSGADAERLPIYVPLASYDEMQRETGDLTVREFLVRYYERRRAAPGLEPIFAEALDTGQALVLLDGLDEVTDATRRQFVAEQVTAFVQSTTTSGNRVMLTSRIYGYRVAPLRGDLPHVTVLDFGRNEIETFARQWYRALALWEADGQQTLQQEIDAQRKERELLDDITSNPGVERLAVNPLLLTMLALLRRQVGVLPQRRIKLYDLYVTALIQTWEENRSRGTRTEPRERVDLQEAEGALIELALWLQQHRQSGTATQEDVLARLEEHYLWHGEGKRSDDPHLTPPIHKRARDMAEKFMHDMRHYSGLLIERGQNAFSFRHLTFQEYFAGRALARMEEKERWELVQPHLHSNRWHEPLLLATARLGTSDNREVAASKLVERILDANSAFEALLHRDLLLAADCAADDVGVELPLLRRIVEALKPLLDSPIPSVGNAARERLLRLTLLRTGERSRLPEAVEILVEHLPFEEVFEAYVQENNNKQKILHKLLTEHSELQQPIVERLTDDDSDVRVSVVEAVTPLLSTRPDLHQPILACLTDDNSSVSRAAIEAIAPLLPDHPKFHQPVLACLIDDTSYVRSTVRSTVIRAIVPLLPTHPELHQPVLAGLTDNDSTVRSTVIRAIVPLLPTHPELHQPVLVCLTDNDSNVRSAAIRAIAPLLPNHPEFHQPVLVYLTDNGSNVRQAAIDALADFLDNKDINTIIHDYLSHIDWRTRATTIKALYGDNQHRRHMSILLKQVWIHESCDESEEAHARIIEVLAPLLRGYPDLRQTISVYLTNNKPSVQQAAIRALAPLLGAYPDLCQTVSGYLTDASPIVRQSAIRALAPLLGKYTTLLSSIRECLTDDDKDVRRVAIRALAPFLEEHRDLRQLVSNQLNDVDLRVQETTIGALAPLLGAHPDLRQIVSGYLTDANGPVQQVAIRALAPLLGEHRDLRQTVSIYLTDANRHVREEAIRAIAPLLTDHPDLRQSIQDQLTDANRHVREAAIRALAPLLGDYPDLRQTVSSYLTDANGHVREAAIRALAPLLGAHPDLLSSIRECLTHDDKDMQKIAIRALAPLLGAHPDLHQPIQARLTDNSPSVQQAAIRALAPLLEDYPDLRQTVSDYLTDDASSIRRSAIEALAPLLGEHPDLRDTVSSYLTSDNGFVKQTAIRALAPLLVDHPNLQQPLLNCLTDTDIRVQATTAQAIAGIVTVEPKYANVLFDLLEQINAVPTRFIVEQEDIEVLMTNLGLLTVSSKEWRAYVIEQLSDFDWRRRAAAAQVLASAGKEAVEEALPQLLQALNDYRGPEAWRSHIAAAELVINDDAFCDQAIELLVSKLDYGVDFVFSLFYANQIRKEAALALGKLKAVDRREDVAQRIAAVLASGRERNSEVLDALFRALSSLVAAPETEQQTT